MEEVLVEVTEGNIHKYTLKDVVLPLIGYKIKLPKNEHLNQIMFDIMNKDNISLNKFEL